MAESSWRNEAAVLPDDLLTEILLFLPAKSLLRFRSVCKNWCSLIQSPSFVANHHNRSKSPNHNECLLVLGSHRDMIDTRIVMSLVDSKTLIPFSDINMDFCSPSPLLLSHSYYGEYAVLGPCNGIICITNTVDIILCNPATRESKTLPFASNCCVTVAFGYDSTSDDYKVARIFNYKVEIYNLSTDSWRIIDDAAPKISISFPLFGKFFNGGFHWYVVEDNGLESIVVFDMKDEVFRLIGLPDSCKYSVEEMVATLLVWNDSLALLNYNCYGTEIYLELWVMKEYGVKETWTKEILLGPLVGMFRPLGIWKDGEFLLENYNGQLVSCDSRSHQVREIDVHGNHETLRAVSYTESLVSVKNFRQLFEE